MINVNFDTAKFKEKVKTTVSNAFFPIGKGQLDFDFDAEVRRLARDEAQKNDWGEVQTQAGPDWLREVAGKEYDDTLREADAHHVATNASEFVSALDSCVADEVIWVPGDVTIDLSGYGNLDAADNVTIASNRDISAGRPGGKIKVDSYDHTYVFKSYSKNLRVTGLRIEGPNPNSVIVNYDSSKSVTFGMFLKDGCRFDNNEVYGWPFAGFASGAKSYAPSHTYDHNHFHDCMMDGLGYGVEMYNGYHTFHHNYFNRVRHCMAGYGRSTNGYEAYHNVTGPEVMSHAFDMHALKQNTSTDSNVAGGRMDIYDNLFMFTKSTSGYPQEAVKIRGIPDQKAVIRGNYFRHKTVPEEPGDHTDAYHQTNSDGVWKNFEAFANTFNTNLTFNDDPLQNT